MFPSQFAGRRARMNEMAVEAAIRPLALALWCAMLASCASVRTPPPAPQQPPPHVALPAMPSRGEPGDLAGLQPAQLKFIFGAPAFVRKDGTAEMWRYDGPACRAFFFLYPYGDSLLVRHVETVPRGGDMAADQACLDTLRTHVPGS
jgi:hypothetical protein